MQCHKGLTKCVTAGELILSVQHGVIFGIGQGTLLYGSTNTETLCTAMASKGNLGILLVLNNNDT